MQPICTIVVRHSVELIEFIEYYRNNVNIFYGWNKCLARVENSLSIEPYMS
jgi:hypothetical protein